MELRSGGCSGAGQVPSPGDMRGRNRQILRLLLLHRIHSAII